MSPFNSPVWVVDKEGVDHLGNTKKRIETDFRKLKSKKQLKTNIPFQMLRDIVKSDFHQIELDERDKEKNTFSVNNGKHESEVEYLGFVVSKENTTTAPSKNNAIKYFFRIKYILKNILSSEDVMLLYPVYRKPFDLTTDAYAHGLCPVLSQ